MSRDADGARPSPLTIFVCQSCGDGKSMLGEHLLDALVRENPDPDLFKVVGVDCLAVCERPVTLTFAAPGKWSYILGDIDAHTDVADIFAAARAVAASPHGVPAMADRPVFFYNGVVARIPPHDWQVST